MNDMSEISRGQLIAALERAAADRRALSPAPAPIKPPAPTTAQATNTTAKEGTSPMATPTTDKYSAFRAKCAAKGLTPSEINELVAADMQDASRRAERQRAGGIDHAAVAAARSVGQGRRRLRQMQAGIF